MLGIEFDTAEHAEEVQWACFERGLLVLECGKSSVRMSPALTVSEAEMATALRIFGEAVAAVAGHEAEVLEPRSPRPARSTRSRQPADASDDARPRGDKLASMSTSKVATMRDAIADLVRDGDTRRDRGLHPPHLVRGRPRDHPPAPPRPDPRPPDAGPHLRPDDRGRRRPQARLLLARQPRASAGWARSAGASRATSRTSRSRSRSTATSGWSAATRRAP